MMQQPISILLVDDEDIKLKLIADWLVGFNCHITYKTTYEDAVGELGNYYDLIICDYFLHNGDTANLGTGKLFKDYYYKNHKDTIFILYSGNRSAICDHATRVEAIDYSEETLRRAILAKISLLSQPKNEDEKPIAMPEVKSQHVHHRWNDKAFWTLQRRLLALALTIIAIGGCIALLQPFAQSVINPCIERVAMYADSVNHIPIQKEIDEIHNIERKNETNIAIIKNLLEVMATSDQLLIAQQRRTNPTGIR